MACVARCEHAYALMAAAAGIQMNATRLLPAEDPETTQRSHLLIEEERDWRLTPAYDITFSPNEGPHDR